MPELLSVSDAVERLLSQFQAVSTTTISIEEALNRVVSQDIASNVDLPPFTNSSMDGYAVIARDTRAASPEKPVTLQVVGDIPAGTIFTGHIQTGQAARIMTGAMLPGGADAVVPIEKTNLHQGLVNTPLPKTIQILQEAKTGDDLRPQGQDLHTGDQVFKGGHRLRSQDLGLLATLGHARVPVYRRPRVALLSSGDELLSPGEPLSPAKIYDSNAYTLAALCEKSGAEVIRLGRVRDDPALIRDRLDGALDHSVDLILTSAGVSVGAFDYVRDVIEKNGRLSFWRINMRPGKPVAFGAYRDIPLLGLPGNPVSAFVGFQVLVAPVLSKLSGASHFRRRTTHATLLESIKSDGRETYFRATLTESCGKITATLAGHQGSGNLFSLTQANALIVVPADTLSLEAGSVVETWMLDD